MYSLQHVHFHCANFGGLQGMKPLDDDAFKAEFIARMSEILGYSQRAPLTIPVDRTAPELSTPLQADFQRLRRLLDDYKLVVDSLPIARRNVP
jgi:hypothetical protein